VSLLRQNTWSRAKLIDEMLQKSSLQSLYTYVIY